MRLVHHLSLSQVAPVALQHCKEARQAEGARDFLGVEGIPGKKSGQTGGSKKRRGQESVRHPTVFAQQEESATGGGSSSQVVAPYCFEFGKYKKQPVKALDQVLQDDPGYVQWAIQSEVHH